MSSEIQYAEISNGKLSPESRARIIQAAQVLSSVCDGAREKDGCGFNGCDSPYFKNYLALEREQGIRSDRIILEMYQKLKKYSKQLEGFGISYSDLTPQIEKIEITVDPSWKTVIMPFGKFKGQSLAEIANKDFEYLHWISESFSDGFIKQAAKSVVAGQPIRKSVSAPAQAQAYGKTQTEEDYIRISVAGEDIIIESSYGYKDRIKELSIRKWDSEKRHWITKLNIIDEILQKFPRAEISQELKTIIESRRALKQRANAMTATRDFALGNFGNGKRILPFQQAGLEFLEIAQGRAMIADEMGTGKTIQAASYLQLHKETRPAVICCPASLKLNWKKELTQWLDTKDDIEILNGGKLKPITASILILNYDILGKWEEELLKISPKIIIFDESHMLKNHKAARTEIATRIAEKIPKVILLTGTPVLNRPVELFSQLHIINPNQYPVSSFFNYAKKYCNAEQTRYGWDMSGASRIPELAKELRAIMIRRTKEQVLPELPEKRRSSVLVPLENVKEYNTQIKEFQKWLVENRGKSTADLDILPQIEYLKQMCCEGKMKSAMEWLEASFIANSQKVVVFATHQKTIDTLMEKFGSLAVKIDGETSQEKRDAAVTAFQNNPNVLMFVGNTKAAGVGITLTAASDVVFLEFDWTPAIHDQAEDRCHRMGQKTSVNAYYLVAAESIDQMILSMLESKRGVTQGVTADNKKLDFNLFEEFYKVLVKPAKTEKQ